MILLIIPQKELLYSSSARKSDKDHAKKYLESSQSTTTLSTYFPIY